MVQRYHISCPLEEIGIYWDATQNMSIYQARFPIVVVNCVRDTKHLNTFETMKVTHLK